jgi:Tfp pilus assembly protein PilZ
MAPDDQSGARPAGPVVLRIKLRYDDLDAMVQRFAPNVGKSGLFLPTKTVQPIGAEVKFELRLANDTPVLVGLGRVKHVRPADPANPKAAFGMAIELMRVTREGREVIIRMIERRRALGLPDVAIPLPDDVDAARRADLDSQPRADTSGIVREAMAQMASAPVSEQILTARPATGPVATARLETAPVPLVKEPVAPATGEPASEAAPSDPPLAARESGRIVRPSSAPFAAPRESGPIVRPVVAALAPEPPRARRPRLHELIAQAESGPIAAAPVELDEHVDVERALARARALAGGDMDAELASLRDSAAAPIEISVEAASAELARQLGCTAIARRDRSARWAPPPASVPATLLARGTDPENPVVDPVALGTPVAVAQVATAEPAAAIESEPAHDAASTSAEPQGARDAVAPAEPQGARDAVAPAEPADVVAESAPADEVSQPAAADAIAELSARDGAAAAAADDDDDDDAFDASAPGTSTMIDPEVLRAARRPDDVDQAFDSSAPGTTTAVEPQEQARRAFARAEDIVTEPGAEPDPPRARSATRPPAMVVEDDAELAAFERALDGAIIRTGMTKPAPPADDLDDDEIEELDSMDLVPEDELPSESTQIGAMPVDPHAYAEQPYSEHPAYGEQPQGEAPFDDQHAYAEQPYAQPHDGAAHNEQHAYGEPPYQQAYGEPPYQQPYAEQPYGEPAYQQPYTGQPYAQGESPYSDEPDQPQEEVSDFDVLAEADAEDADLLAAHGEHDVSGNAPAAPPAGEGSFDFAAAAAPPGEGSFDFASRLDLGDDDGSIDRGYGAGVDMRRHRSYGDGYDDGPPAYADARRQPSYADERPSYDSFDSPSSSYTFAEPVPAPPQQPSVLRDAPPEDLDLETALEALDVDLDELGALPDRRKPALPGLPAPRTPTGPVATAPRTPTGQVPVRATGGSRTVPPPLSTPEPATERATARARRTETPARALATAKPAKPSRAATEDDGVLIDFDDDD